MLVPYTPPASLYSLPLDPAKATLLTLPTELRLQIYALVLQPLTTQPRPLRLEYRPPTAWLVRLPHPPTRPSTNSLAVLRLNKQTYTEVLPLLYSLVPGGATLSIQSVQCHTLPWVQDPKQWELYARLPGCELREPRRAVKDFMRGLRRCRADLTVEVEVSEGMGEQALMVAVLRWVRSVVNEAPGLIEEDALSGVFGGGGGWEERLGRVSVVYRGRHRGFKPRAPTGLWEVFRGWRCGGMEGRYWWWIGEKLRAAEPFSGWETPVETEHGFWESVKWAEGGQVEESWSDEETAWAASEKMIRRVEEARVPERKGLVLDVVAGSPSQVLRWMRAGRR